MSKNRINRIDEEVKRALAQIIQTEVKDDRLSPMASVTAVEITPDLKFAKVYISVYDTDKNKNATIDALNHGAAFIRTKLAKTVAIRRVPELHFLLDRSVDYGLKIAQLLEDAKKQNRE